MGRLLVEEWRDLIRLCITPGKTCDRLLSTEGRRHLGLPLPRVMVDRREDFVARLIRSLISTQSALTTRINLSIDGLFSN